MSESPKFTPTPPPFKKGNYYKVLSTSKQLGKYIGAKSGSGYGITTTYHIFEEGSTEFLPVSDIVRSSEEEYVKSLEPIIADTFEAPFTVGRLYKVIERPTVDYLRPNNVLGEYQESWPSQKGFRGGREYGFKQIIRGEPVYLTIFEDAVNDVMEYTPAHGGNRRKSRTKKRRSNKRSSTRNRRSRS